MYPERSTLAMSGLSGFSDTLSDLGLKKSEGFSLGGWMGGSKDSLEFQIPST